MSCPGLENSLSGTNFNPSGLKDHMEKITEGCSDQNESSAMIQPGTTGQLIDERRRSNTTSAAWHHPGRPDGGGLKADAVTSIHRHAHLNGVAQGEQIFHGAFSDQNSHSPCCGESFLSKSWPRGGMKDPTTSLQDVLSQSVDIPRRAGPPQGEQASDVALQAPVGDGDDDGGGGGCENDGDGPRQRSQQLKVPVLDDKQKEGGKDDDGDGRNRRFLLRLMVSMFVALIPYITALISEVPVLSQYLFRRTAVEHFNLTNVTLHQTPCAEGQNDSLRDALNWVQARTSQQLLYFDLCRYIPAVFVSLFVGSYADYFGRKFLVLMPMFGGFLKSLVILLVVYLEEDLNYLYLAFALDGLLGSFYALEVGLFSAMADVSISSRQRVMLFAFLEISLALAGALSQIGTGFLIDAVGFVVPSLTMSCLLFTACACVLLFMPETLRNRPQQLVLNPLVHLRKVFGFYFWDGSVTQRALFLCGQTVLFLVTMINLGRMPVETLFVMNSPLCWGSIHIGLFIGLRLLLQNMSGFVTLKVLSPCVRIELIGMLGLMSGATGFILQSLADTDPWMYTSATVGLLSAVVAPVSRTLLSRMAPADRQGALFASLSAIETVCHLSASTIYNNVYAATLEVFPGAVFALMSGILLLDCALLILFTMVSRKCPHFQEVQVEVKAPDADVPPSLMPPPFVCDDDDETTPLLPDSSSVMTRGRFRRGKTKPTASA